MLTKEGKWKYYLKLVVGKVVTLHDFQVCKHLHKKKKVFKLRFSRQQIVSKFRAESYQSQHVCWKPRLLIKVIILSSYFLFLPVYIWRTCSPSLLPDRSNLLAVVCTSTTWWEHAMTSPTPRMTSAILSSKKRFWRSRRSQVGRDPD